MRNKEVVIDGENHQKEKGNLSALTRMENEDAKERDILLKIRETL
jgi:hypothetical protein